MWLACIVTLWTVPGLATEPFAAEEFGIYRAWVRELAADMAASPNDTLEGGLGAGVIPRLSDKSAEPAAADASRLTALRRLRALDRLQNLPGGQRELTAAQSLAAAQECRRLAEYDNALAWCRRAAELDVSGTLSADIRRETLASAVAAGDSLTFVHVLLNTLGASDLTGRESELVLAYRHLFAHNDYDRLAMLDAKVAGQLDRLGARVQCWRALSAAQRQDWHEALAGLRVLLRRDNPAQELTLVERTWVAVALADLLFLIDQRAEAAQLYAELEANGPRSGRAWSRYQLANLDLLAGRYEAARLRYAELCPASDPTRWQPRACALAAVADTLAALAKEGGRHGADYPASH